MLLVISMFLCSLILLLRVLLCTVAFQLMLLVALLPPLIFHAAFLATSVLNLLVVLFLLVTMKPRGHTQHKGGR